VDLTGFYRLAARDRRLGPLVLRFHGVKPPRFPTLFETLGNAIACQQVTLNLGILLLNRLAQTYGFGMQRQGECAYSYPRPEEVGALHPDGLRPLGFSGQKSRALVGLARAITETRIDLNSLANLEDETAVTRLREFWGVGRWSAEYVLLRGLGRLHVFPGDDVGARNHLQRWLGRAASFDYGGVQRALQRWKLYAGLVYFHLLLKRLAERGYLS
jgi:DNA-3-methyladenine glycosylase II